MRVYAVQADVDATKAYPAEARKEWSDVGEVNDVVLDWNGDVKAVVLGVGGFLGVGEKNVAIEMSSLRKVRESDDSNDWFLVVNSSKEMLTNAPTYTTTLRHSPLRRRGLCSPRHTFSSQPWNRAGWVWNRHRAWIRTWIGVRNWVRPRICSHWKLPFCADPKATGMRADLFHGPLSTKPGNWRGNWN